MEHPVQRKTEVDRETGLSMDSLYRARQAGALLTVDTQAGRLVDEKISDVIRMTIATCRIVLESDGVDSAAGAKMQDRVLRMLGVKERRS